MADKKDNSRSDSVPKPPPKPLPTFDERPKPLTEERIRKHDPVISDTFKPPPPKKG